MTKKRITKRVVALAAAAMMLVGMVVPAVAAPGDQGTITVHKYSGNNASITQNNTGEALSAAELADLTTAGYTALPGARFTLYQAVAADILAINNTITTTPGLTVVDRVIDTTGATPVIKFELSNSTVVNVNTTQYGTEQTTDAAGEATFGSADLPNGWYVLVETFTPADHTGAEPSLIQMPLTDTNGDPNYDVHVYPKNVSTTGIVKKDMGDVAKPVENGDVLDFDLKLRFKNAETNPAFKVDSAQDFVNDAQDAFGIARITEYLSNVYFEYVQNSIAVYWLDSAGEVDTTRPLASTEYTITGLPAAGVKGGTIVVELNQAGLKAAKAGHEVGFGIDRKSVV